MPDRPTEIRPFWSGTLTFGLVSVQVELFTAVRPSRVALRMLGPEGRPVQRRYVCPAEERAVEGEDIVRGVEVDEGWVTVTDAELEALEPDKTREIDLRRFVDRESIDPVYCDRPYFLLPQGEVTKPYRLLAHVMEQTGRAGIASFVMRGREHLIAILAEGGVLRAETLRHAAEVRGAEEVGLPEPVEVDPDRVEAMRAAIESLAAEEVAMEELADTRAEALRELAAGKSGEQLVRVPEEASRGEGRVIDLMAVLKARLGVEPEASSA